MRKYDTIVTNTNFWKVIKLPYTKKGHINNGGIILTNGEIIITYEKELVKVFNNHYINIIKNTFGKKTMPIANENNIHNITLDIELIPYK